MRKHISLQFIPVAVAMLMTGCSLLDPNPGPDPISPTSSASNLQPASDTLPATVERGGELYTQYCARCHGDSAEGTPIWESSIRGRTAIVEVVRTGRRTMPSFPTLSDSAITAIERFLGSFPVVFTGKSGQELYMEFCSSCHGDSALGTNTFAGSIQAYEPIHDIVVNGKGEMLPLALPDSVIAKIQEYLSGFHVDLSTLTGAEYFAHECAGCHGIGGEGTTRGYDIRNPVTGYASYVIRHGRPGIPYFAEAMPDYPTSSLSQQQLNEMIAMLRSAPKPTDGAGLYNRFCANCHGKDGRGGPTGKGILNELGEIHEKVREGEGGTNYGNRGKYMPAWSRTELTDNEVSLISSYVRQLR